MTSAINLISEQKSFVWKIPNFVQLRKSRDRIKAQHCTINLHGDVEERVLVQNGNSRPSSLNWKCMLDITEDRNGNEEAEEREKYVGFKMNLENLPQDLEGYYAKVRVKIDQYLDQDGTMPLKFLLGYGFRLPKMMPQFSSSSPYLSPSGILRIQISIAIYNPEKTNAELALLEARYDKIFTTNFRSKLSDLRKNPLNISSLPTKIISKEGEELPVDRVILAARSPVFQAMFQSNMTEEQKGVVEVKDMYSKSLEVLLHFMHTGELLENWKTEGVIVGLVYGAHKYMMDDLLQFLGKAVGLVCTDRNCGKLMGLARTFAMEKAQEGLFLYFKKHLVNNVEEVLRFAEETAMTRGIMLPTQEEPASEENGGPDRKRMRTSV